MLWRAPSIASRRPFHPPSPTATPVLVRATTFAGELGHPLTSKRTIVVPISLLPLDKTSSAVYASALHNVKVLAGPRWTIEPPKNAGLPSWRHEPVYEQSVDDSSETGGLSPAEIGKEGYIKISCELFPETQMNLKWCMDTLRRLVKEANVRSSSHHQPFNARSNPPNTGTRGFVYSWCIVHRHPTPDKTPSEPTTCPGARRRELQGGTETNHVARFPEGMVARWDWNRRIAPDYIA